MSMLDELLSIKSFRETKAEIAVFNQRVSLAKAQARRDAAQERLLEFRDYALRRELEMYGDLCSRMVHLRDIQDVQESVGVLRTQERDCVVVLDEAEGARDREAETLKACKLVFSEASRIKQKFVELAEAEDEEEFRLAERNEDAEMEEIAEIRRDRADWQEFVEDAV